MAPRTGPPLRKVTLNLYHDDVIKLQHSLGLGYSTWIRELVHEKLKDEPQPKPAATYEPFLIEDLDDDLP